MACARGLCTEQNWTELRWYTLYVNKVLFLNCLYIETYWHWELTSQFKRISSDQIQVLFDNLFSLKFFVWFSLLGAFGKNEENSKRKKNIDFTNIKSLFEFETRQSFAYVCWIRVYCKCLSIECFMVDFLWLVQFSFMYVMYAEISIFARLLLSLGNRLECDASFSRLKSIILNPMQITFSIIASHWLVHRSNILLKSFVHHNFRFRVRNYWFVLSVDVVCKMRWIGVSVERGPERTINFDFLISFVSVLISDQRRCVCWKKKMDLATPTTSKATKPKRRRRPKPFTPNRSRKPKNVRVKLVVEPAHNFFEIEKILRKAEFVSSGGEVNIYKS